MKLWPPVASATKTTAASGALYPAEIKQAMPTAAYRAGVGLVERAVHSGLVARLQDATDRRVVNVSLTPAGEEILLKLTHMHYQEAIRLRALWQNCELASPPMAEKGPRGSI